MKLIHVLQMMLVLLIFFELVKSVLGDEDKNKKKGPVANALKSAYIMAAMLSFISITWALFDDHYVRFYRRLLPSWMWSNPYATLQSGTLVEQSKARRGIYELLGLQFSTHSLLTIPEPLEHNKLNGCPISGALREIYRLSNLPIMGHPDAITPSAPGKSCLLAQLSIMQAPDLIQVWHIRETPLPERMGRPRLAPEQELRGEVEEQDEAIRRDTVHRLREGRPQETMNVLGTEPMVGEGNPLLPNPAEPRVRHARVFSTPPVQDPPDSEAVRLARRLQQYPEDLERRIQEARTDGTLMLVRGSLEHLENLMQELGRTRRTRQRQAIVVSSPPVIEEDLLVPEDERRADRLQRYIEDLERRIHDLRTEPTLDPSHGRLDSLMHELRGARIARGRLPPNANLHPAVPTAQYQLQNIQTTQLPNPIQNTAEEFEPRPRVTTVQGPITAETINAVDGLYRLATENLERHLRHLQNSQDVLNTQTFAAISDIFNTLLQRLVTRRANLVLTASLGPARPITQTLLGNVQNINASTPTIVTPQIHGEASRAIIEGVATDDNTSSTPTSEEEVHGAGDRAFIEGPRIDEASSSDFDSEMPLEIQHPIAAAILQSVLDHDATLDLPDPVAQRHPESNDAVRAEATRQTAAFYNDLDRSDSAPDVHVQDVQTDNGTIPTNTLHSPASLPIPTATTTLAAPRATLSAQQLEDILNEELYSDD